MKNLLLITLLFVSSIALGQPQVIERSSKVPVKVTEIHQGTEIKLKVDSAEAEYGRAFIIIQSSSEPSEELKKWLINVPGQLWKKYQIVPYISIQIGIPSGPPCGPPPRKPC